MIDLIASDSFLPPERSRILSPKNPNNIQWKIQWKYIQNTHVEVHIFAKQKSKARSRDWIVQNNLHIAET